MRHHGNVNFVFSSTCAIYDVPQSLPILETTPQDPVNPYGFTKLFVEKLLMDYQRAYGLKWIALRYFNACGCDADGDLGERHDPETHAIPLAIAAAFGTGSKFQVFGTDYDTEDGTAVRDYIHVTDLANAHVKAMIHLAIGGESAAFNLGTGCGTSVLEMIKAVENAVGRKVPVEFSPRRAGDPPVLFADAKKASEILAWQPEYTQIGPIVETAVRWFEKSR